MLKPTRIRPYYFLLPLGLALLVMGVYSLFQHTINPIQVSTQEVSARVVPPSVSTTNKLPPPPMVTPADRLVLTAVPAKEELQSVEHSPQTARPYTAESIHDALEQVNLDANGQLIIDHDALMALQQTMGHSALELDTLQLAELQALIEFGLPGPAGQQVAIIAGQFYHYLNAKREYFELHRDNAHGQDFYDVQQHLTQLRHEYLGETLTQQLFSRTNAEKQYFYERFQLTRNSDLGPEERSQQTQAINQRLKEGLAASLGLESQYQDYLQAKTQVIRKSKDKDSQYIHTELQALWKAYFTEGEQQALRALNIHPSP